MEAVHLHVGVFVAATYVLAGLIPERGGAWRPVMLAVIPSVGAWVTLGMEAWPGGLAAVLVGGVSAAGYSAQTRAQTGAIWIVCQTGVLLALVGLVAWAAPRGGPISAEVAALAGTAAGLVVAVEWGGEFVRRAIEPFTREFHAASRDASAPAVDLGLPKGFAEGGKTIGRWERLLIFLFVLAGSPEAVGFLVTAKSILRFGEIKDRSAHKEAEYIIIGTLMSFGFALVVSAVVRLALGALVPEVLTALALGS